MFDAHLWMPLEHHKPTYEFRNGRWYLDSKTTETWRALDGKFTQSINIIRRTIWLPLEHHQPSAATAFGFMGGHKTQGALLFVLKVSKHTFIHRFAYLTYLVAHRYHWESSELGDQP